MSMQVLAKRPNNYNSKFDRPALRLKDNYITLSGTILPLLDFKGERTSYLIEFDKENFKIKLSKDEANGYPFRIYKYSAKARVDSVALKTGLPTGEYLASQTEPGTFIFSRSL